MNSMEVRVSADDKAPKIPLWQFSCDFCPTDAEEDAKLAAFEADRRIRMRAIEIDADARGPHDRVLSKQDEARIRSRLKRRALMQEVRENLRRKGGGLLRPPKQIPSAIESLDAAERMADSLVLERVLALVDRRRAYGRKREGHQAEGYTTEQKSEWLRLAEQMWSKGQSSVRAIARTILREKGLPDSSFETVRKHIAGAGVDKA